MQLSDKIVDSRMGGGLLGADLGTTTERFGGFFDEEEENSLDEDGESEECQVSVGRMTIAHMKHQNEEAKHEDDDNNLFGVASASESKKSSGEDYENNMANQNETKGSDQGS